MQGQAIYQIFHNLHHITKWNAPLGLIMPNRGKDSQMYTNKICVNCMEMYLAQCPKHFYWPFLLSLSFGPPRVLLGIIQY